MTINDKLEQGIELKEYEISDLIFEYEIYSEGLSFSRWTRQMYSLVLYNDRIYEIYWERGLTEYQDNVFYSDQLKEITEYYYKKRSYYIELVDKLNDILLRSNIITQNEREDIVKSFTNQNKKYFVKF